MSELPSGWASGTLGDLVQPERVGVAPASVADLPYLGLENVEAQTTKIIGTAPASSVRSTSYRFQPDATLFARLRPYLNKVCTPTFEGIGSGEFIIFPPSPHIAPGFLKYLLNQPAFVQFTATLDTGDRPRVNWNGIKQFPCALPPLREQERIVAAIEEQFSRLEVAVTTLERITRSIERLRASVLQNLIGFGSAEPLPDGWRWTTIANVAGGQKSPVLTGPFGTTLGRGDFVRDGVPVLTIGCLTPEGISLSKAPRVVAEKAASLHRYALEEGDVLFSRMATVGRAAVVGSREAGSLINYHLMRLRLNQSVLDPNYLALLCRGSRAVQQHLTSSNHGVTRAGINTKQLMGLPLALPPRTEQTAIVEQVKAVDDLCSRFVRQVMQARQRAGTLRASILVTAFAGKLASQDASDEPASALLEQIAAQEASSSKQKVARAPKPRRERATA